MKQGTFRVQNCRTMSKWMKDGLHAGDILNMSRSLLSIATRFFKKKISRAEFTVNMFHHREPFSSFHRYKMILYRQYLSHCFSLSNFSAFIFSLSKICKFLVLLCQPFLNPSAGMIQYSFLYSHYLSFAEEKTSIVPSYLPYFHISQVIMITITPPHSSKLKFIGKDIIILCHPCIIINQKQKSLPTSTLGKRPHPN